jgi:parallel beta-helix repeat protein
MNNTAINNYYGIYEAGGAVIGDNVVVDNTNGIFTAVSSYQSILFRNTARGNGTDYSVNSDAYGPFITRTGVITNLSPWANFDL